ncbi:hypothetical protein LTR08_002857 [Meristemomyces frigidus]|nr:hypothetical protein LTR08_002857 [Meristemomyces frigidus]
MASLLLPPLEFSRFPSFVATTPTKLPLSDETEWVDSSDDDDDESLNSNLEKEAESPVQTCVESVPLRLPRPATIFAPALDSEGLRASLGLERRDTVGSTRHKKLIKRNTVIISGCSGGESGKELVERSSAILSKGPPSTQQRQSEVEDGAKSYRCDIHAPNSRAYVSTETACKRLVLEAGGKVVEDFAYVGGFLYQLPPQSTNPLATGPFSLSSPSTLFITVTPWQPFPPALFNGLRLAHSGAIMPIPQHRALPPPAQMLVAQSCGDLTRKRTSAWLGHMVKNYGKSVSYLT